jgi:riboflavin synthase
LFTGIVEEIGCVEQLIKGSKSAKLRIRAKTVLEGTRIGDSICTSGVCLTVTGLDGKCFEADVMGETMRCSKLGSLVPGSSVNLERAMQLNGRFGGHVVSGHIDGTGKITAVSKEDQAVWLTVSADPMLLRYIVEKGSVAVDGVSLTVAAEEPSAFQVSVIPHTGKETTLLRQSVGDLVNLECDIIGKYVEKLFGGRSEQSAKPEQGRRPQQLSEVFLKENGF